MIINGYLFLITLLLNIHFSLCKTKDQISLQWSICDLKPETVLEKLDKKEIQRKKVAPLSFFDTDSPTYITQGLMLRKKMKSKKKYALVKKKFMNGEVSVKVPDADCLWYRYGDDINYVCMILSPLNGTTLWSSRQIRFVENVYNKKIYWNRLVEFGPYINTKWEAIPVHGYKVVFDDVVVESLHLMEFEVKVPEYKGDAVYNTITNYLKRKGVILCDKQETKSLRLFRHMGYFVKNDQNHQHQMNFGSSFF